MAKTKDKPRPTGVTIDQEYEIVSIDGDTDVLKEHPQNPKQGDVEIIDESIDENGWYGALVAQRSTGYILAGNHRYRVAKEKGATEIPVIWKDVDDETALKILLVDNMSADAGTYDEAKLDAALAGLTTLRGTGYAQGADDAIRDAEEAAAAPEEVPDDDGPEDVPDDVYTPSFGVMVVCTNEEHQQHVYEVLQKELPGVPLRLVAV